MAEKTSNSDMLYQLEARPPAASAMYVGFQHLLAIFGGIVTAPLLVALGMGLDTAETTYVISSALMVSGVATLLQINRLGMLGTGLLSIQGTSFAFIGPLVFSYHKLTEQVPSAEALGTIFGSTAVCAILTMVLSLFVRHLRNVITSNVAGATIILLGISLVVATIDNLRRSFEASGGFEGDGLLQMTLAGVVFLVILVISNLSIAWLRISSITIGLAAGILGSLALGMVDFSTIRLAEAYFVPELNRYPIGVDLTVVALIMPIFLVSAMESIGDITATNILSGLRTGSAEYWSRIRGGIMVGGLASLVAAMFSTFPSTTFSQNNGVIRLTGVCSRFVGNYVAVFLVLLGCLPVIAAIFQAIPDAVIFGATLLMFMLVAISGYKVVEMSGPQRRDWFVVGLAIGLGYVVSLLVDRVPGLPAEVVMVLQFPVSTGAMLAILIEAIVPGRQRDAGTSD